MKKVYLFAVVVVVSFALLQSVEAGSRGASRSFSSVPHFSAPVRGYAGPSRNYSGGTARYYSAPRVPSMSMNRSSYVARPRFSPTTTALRNPTYTSNARRFAGDRTAAFNSRTFTPSNARVTTANRTLGNRSQAFNRGRVIGQYNASRWNRHWDRGRDHWWRGHRCHFRNGFWFIYDPFPFYPYGYGFYPYASYYSEPYYDDSYATNDYAQSQETDQPQYQVDSQVSSVQSALAREGYYDGAIDGRLGPATQRALRKYQRDHGLPATGAIDRAVIQALRLR